jgi:hypothetical protein
MGFLDWLFDNGPFCSLCGRGISSENVVYIDGRPYGSSCARQITRRRPCKPFKPFVGQATKENLDRWERENRENGY